MLILGCSHRYQDIHTTEGYLHSPHNAHTSPGHLYTWHWALSPLSPGSSLVFSIPLCLSPLGLSVGLPSLGEVAMWWERQRLHRPTPPESAGVQQALLFWVGPFHHPPGPTVTTKQQ